MNPLPQSAPTHFAPGERCDAADLGSFAEAVVNDPIVSAILSSIPGSVVILNRHRQILAANREVLDSLGLEEPASLVGQRPGEALSCIHAAEGPSGCGTSRHCRVCGAVLAILAALEHRTPVREECTLSLTRGNRLSCVNLAVHATPIEVLGQPCLEFVFHDISDRKMREALDRIFLHDLGNAVTGVLGWAEVLRLRDEDDATGRLLQSSQGLAALVESQATILGAESGELAARPRSVTVSSVLDGLEGAVRAAPWARPGPLEIERGPGLERLEIDTDPDLLHRVLVNMVRNAFEALHEGDRVRAWFHRTPEGRSCFSVHNPGAIAEEIQLRIFQRAFSTKPGSGHGFGTYGMKLIGQNYLGADVGFESTPATGTRFFICLPPARSS